MVNETVIKNFRWFISKNHDYNPYPGGSANFYLIQEGGACWTYYEAGGAGNWIVSGQKVVLAPVTPGQTWKNTYM
jgi:hypothetical protein